MSSLFPQSRLAYLPIICFKIHRTILRDQRWQQRLWRSSLLPSTLAPPNLCGISEGRRPSAIVQLVREARRIHESTWMDNQKHVRIPPTDFREPQPKHQSLQSVGIHTIQSTLRGYMIAHLAQLSAWKRARRRLQMALLLIGQVLFEMPSTCHVATLVFAV